MSIEVLDLFSAAAGGWSLGMHRAGFETIAACECIAWRRALYQQNNPGVKIYDDVRTLTADRLVRDFGRLPSVIVGSPPCQDISSANTKGKGVEGDRSGLFFEAVRIIGECRPRWFALENSANLRTRGADAVLAALEALGYTCWPFVVRAGDIGANHERPRSWLIGCDLAQVSHTDDAWQHASSLDEQMGELHSLADCSCNAAEIGCGTGLPGRRAGATSGAEQSPRWDAFHAARFGHEGRRAWRHGQDGNGSPSTASGAGNATDPDQAGRDTFSLSGRGSELGEAEGEAARGTLRDGVQIFGGITTSAVSAKVGLCEADRLHALRGRSDWSLDDLADRIRVDDELSAWVAQSRVDVGGKRGTSAAGLLVEAFGDAVVPQIPEAIGRAILRVEAALATVYGRAAA